MAETQVWGTGKAHPGGGPISFQRELIRADSDEETGLINTVALCICKSFAVRGECAPGEKFKCKARVGGGGSRGATG